MLGWGGLTLLDGSTGDRQLLAFGQLRQRLAFVVVVRLRIFHAGAVGGVQRPPAGLLHRAAFGGELRAIAFHRDSGLGVGIGRGHRAQQAQGHQLQNCPLTHRQGGQVRLPDVAGGDHRMMVGHFLVVDDRRRIAGDGDALAERHGVGDQIHQHRQPLGHVGSQVAAVGPGIGAELLFIEVLQVVQCLLRSEAQQSIGVPLECCQVVEGGRLLGFVLALHLFHRGGRTLTGGFQLFGIGFFVHAGAGSGKAGQVQLYRIKRHRLEGVDLGLPLDNKGQRRGHNAANVEGAVVQHRKQPGGVDTHQPVGLGPAEGCLMQTIIVRAGAQVGKALPDGGILHAGDPQPAYGLGAARQTVDGAENQLALAPGIAGVDHLGHVLPPQQGTQHIELIPFVLGDGEAPGLRQNRQVIIAPLGVVRVIGGGIGQPGQVPQAPAHQPAAALQVTVFAGSSAQYSGQRICHRGLLGNYQFHFCLLLSRSHAVSSL